MITSDLGLSKTIAPAFMQVLAMENKWSQNKHRDFSVLTKDGYWFNKPTRTESPFEDPRMIASSNLTLIRLPWTAEIEPT